MVQVTLVEANEILSAFDGKLRAYTERLINKRKGMHIVKAAVTRKPSREPLWSFCTSSVVFQSGLYRVIYVMPLFWVQR